MKLKLICLALALLFAACSDMGKKQVTGSVEGVPPIDKSLAPKPPMGWNSRDWIRGMIRG